MTDTARAVVFSGPGRPLELARHRAPALAPGEVLARVALCTICGSDLHSYFGRRSTPTPTVLGHEILGVVQAMGPGPVPCDFYGRPLQMGQRITWGIAASCGQCFYCTHQLPQKCERLFKYGHQAIVAGDVFSGGLASVCHLKPGTTIVPIPEHLSDEIACPANCATATVAAAVRVAQIEPHETVLLHGAGMLGLTACAMLNSLGVERVVMCEPAEERRGLALRFGAHLVLAPDPKAMDDTVRGLTKGRGVDAAIDFSGDSVAVAQQLDHLRLGGRCVLVGTTRPGQLIGLDAERITRSCWTLRGLHNYTPVDLARAVEFLGEHGNRYPFAEMVKAVFPLAQAFAAFEHAEQAKPPRVAVKP